MKCFLPCKVILYSIHSSMWFICNLRNLLKILLVLFIVLNCKLSFGDISELKAYFNSTKAHDLYTSGKLEDAEAKLHLARFSSPENLQILYNIGVINYRKRNYQESMSIFNKVAKESQNLELKAKAFHNLGNSAYKLGLYQEAIIAYQNSLNIKEDDKTRYNLQQALKKLQNNFTNNNKDLNNLQNSNIKNQNQQDIKNQNQQNKNQSSIAPPSSIEHNKDEKSEQEPNNKQNEDKPVNQHKTPNNSKNPNNNGAFNQDYSKQNQIESNSNNQSSQNYSNNVDNLSNQTNELNSHQNNNNLSNSNIVQNNIQDNKNNSKQDLDNFKHQKKEAEDIKNNISKHENSSNNESNNQNNSPDKSSISQSPTISNTNVASNTNTLGNEQTKQELQTLQAPEEELKNIKLHSKSADDNKQNNIDLIPSQKAQAIKNLKFNPYLVQKILKDMEEREKQLQLRYRNEENSSSKSIFDDDFDPFFMTPEEIRNFFERKKGKSNRQPDSNSDSPDW